MKYVSTRGEAEGKGFAEILLEGLAPDGGLYVPERYPRVDAATLNRWRGLSYAVLAFEILSLYIDDIPPADLRRLLDTTYTAEVFGTKIITPLRALEPGVFVLGLSNGPTLAFKDVAMQFLGHAFEYELARRDRTLKVLGATSGDTGSAAEHALKGKRGVEVFMLSPLDRMSPFQQAQMFSLQEANIHLRRRHVETDDLGGFRHEVRIGALAPGFAARQVDLLGAQKPPDILFVDVDQFPRDQLPGPIRIARRGRLIQQRQYPSPGVRAVFRLRTPLTGLVQTRQPIGGVANPPLRCRPRRAADATADLPRRHPRRRQQHDPGALPQPVLALRRTRQTFKFGAFLRAQINRRRIWDTSHPSLESRLDLQR